MKRVSQQIGFKLAGLILVSAMFSACQSVGPDYAPPSNDVPQQWQDLNASADTNTEAALRRNGQTVSMLEGFALFEEEPLSRLQERALANNQDLQVALLRFAQSRLQRNIQRHCTP